MAIKAGDIVYTIDGNMGGLTGVLAKANTQIKSASAGIMKHHKAISKSMLVAGTAITAAMGLSVKAAMSFESGLRNVGTLGVENMAAMKEGILDYTEVMGKDAVQATEDMYQVLSKGIKEADSLKILESAAIGAAIGIGETSDAIDLGTSLLNAYGRANVKGADDTEKFGNIMGMATKTIALGATTMAELGAVMGRVAPIASQAGISMEELFASIATSTSVGIKSSEAISGLKAAITSILKPTKEAASLSEAMGFDFSATGLKTMKLGGFVTELTKTIKEQGPELAGNRKLMEKQIATMEEAEGGTKEFKKQLKGLKDSYKDLEGVSEDQLTMMAAMFGSVEGLNVMLAQASEEGAAKFTEAVKGMGTAQEDMAAAWEKFKDENPELAFQQMMASVRRLSIDIGDILIPKLVDLFKFLKPIIQGIGDLAKTPVGGVIVEITGALGLMAIPLSTIGFFLPLIVTGFKAVGGMKLASTLYKIAGGWVAVNAGIAATPVVTAATTAGIAATGVAAGVAGGAIAGMGAAGTAAAVGGVAATGVAAGVAGSAIAGMGTAAAYTGGTSLAALAVGAEGGVTSFAALTAGATTAGTATTALGTAGTTAAVGAGVLAAQVAAVGAVAVGVGLIIAEDAKRIWGWRTANIAATETLATSYEMQNKYIEKLRERGVVLESETMKEMDLDQRSSYINTQLRLYRMAGIDKETELHLAAGLTREQAAVAERMQRENDFSLEQARVYARMGLSVEEAASRSRTHLSDKAIWAEWIASQDVTIAKNARVAASAEETSARQRAATNTLKTFNDDYFRERMEQFAGDEEQEKRLANLREKLATEGDDVFSRSTNLYKLLIRQRSAAEERHFQSQRTLIIENMSDEERAQMRREELALVNTRIQERRLEDTRYVTEEQSALDNERFSGSRRSMKLHGDAVLTHEQWLARNRAANYRKGTEQVFDHEKKLGELLGTERSKQLEKLVEAGKVEGEDVKKQAKFVSDFKRALLGGDTDKAVAHFVEMQSETAKGLEMQTKEYDKFFGALTAQANTFRAAMAQPIAVAPITATAAGGIIGKAAGGVVSALAMAAGGVISAAAGRIVKVGERGEELVGLPVGARVMSHSAMTQAVQQGSGGGAVTVNINNPTVRNDNDITRIAEAVKEVFTTQLESKMSGRGMAAIQGAY